LKKNIKNLQASVRARLQNRAKETNRPFLEILQYYGMERFLYRFSCSKYTDKFILKGALMFTVWQVPEYRTTLDIDFLGNYDNQVATIERVVKDICSVQATPDGLVFDTETVEGQRIKEEEEIYDEKSDRQTLWKAFLKRGNIKLAPERLSDTAREIEKFLVEPLDAINSNYEFHKIWDISGVWK